MVTLFLNLTACNNSNGKTSSVYEISLSSDYDNSNEKSLSFFAMDTYMNFKAYGENANTAVNEASALVEDLENKLSSVRRYFNSATKEYNNAVETFPSNILAGMFGFRKEVMFDLGEQRAALEEAPKIKF